MRLTIPDVLADRIDQEATQTQIPVEHVAARHLARSLDMGPLTDRFLIVPPVQRERLEAVLGTCRGPGELLQRVENVVTLSIQGVKISLDVWQLEELKRRADKNGTSAQQELQKAVAGYKDLLFHGLQMGTV